MSKTKAQLQAELDEALDRLRIERENGQWWMDQAYKGIQDLAGIPEDKQVRPIKCTYEVNPQP